jgi:hypothetical protein
LSYQSPHNAREFLFAASLQIVHDFQILCQRRAIDDKKSLVLAVREIDLCARLASFFGSVGHLAAQGTDDVDLMVKGPAIDAEVKYLCGRPWTNIVNGIEKGVKADWDWLLEGSSAGDAFRKRAWVVFWPSADFRRFPGCVSVSKSAGGSRFRNRDFAPFAPFAEPVMPPTGKNQRLQFKAPDRLSVLKLHGGKRVRVDIVGTVYSPIWAAIYTRTTKASASPDEREASVTTISDSLLRVT